MWRLFPNIDRIPEVVDVLFWGADLEFDVPNEMNMTFLISGISQSYTVTRQRDKVRHCQGQRPHIHSTVNRRVTVPD